VTSVFIALYKYSSTTTTTTTTTAAAAAAAVGVSRRVDG